MISSEKDYFVWYSAMYQLKLEWAASNGNRYPPVSTSDGNIDLASHPCTRVLHGQLS